jgi:outer membrane protein TolC
VTRIERLALDAGAGVQTDYLVSEADLLRARASLTEARQAAVSARIQLALITGELSGPWLANNVETTQ